MTRFHDSRFTVPAGVRTQACTHGWLRADRSCVFCGKKLLDIEPSTDYPDTSNTDETENNA